MNSRIWGASLLVAGTSIGAAMLALPLASVTAGFQWSLIVLVISWFFMYATGLCIIEVASAYPSHSSSFVTLAENTLGKIGGKITALSFFCLLYSLLAAYITGGGDLLQGYLSVALGDYAIPNLGILVWTALFASIIYLGVFIGDQVNRLLMLMLFVLYGVLTYKLNQHVNPSNLLHADARALWVALPIVFTAHAYHIVIPSIYHYLGEDARQTKKALLFGSLIPLGLYMVWEYIVFGVIPLSGEQGLAAIKQSQHTTSDLTHAFELISGSTVLGQISGGFIFFAIASSFLGVSMGMFDLIKDVTDKWNLSLNKMSRLLITFAPAFVYGVLYPQGFLLALSYAGIFVAFLHGMLPVLMVMGKRYRCKADSPYKMAGGLPILLVLLLFYVLVVILDVF